VGLLVVAGIHVSGRRQYDRVVQEEELAVDLPPPHPLLR
jgi:hypothetical protein